MYTVLSKIEDTLEEWKEEGKITEIDALQITYDMPKYERRALDLKTLSRMARAYGGAGVHIIDEKMARVSFHWDGAGFDGACQFAKALHSLRYDVNIIHEQSGSRTTVEWR